MIETLAVKVGFISHQRNTNLLKFFPVPIFRNTALQCLTEIANLSLGNVYDPHFVRLFVGLMGQLSPLLPSTTGIYQIASNSLHL